MIRSWPMTVESCVITAKSKKKRENNTHLLTSKGKHKQLEKDLSSADDQRSVCVIFVIYIRSEGGFIALVTPCSPSN